MPRITKSDQFHTSAHAPRAAEFSFTRQINGTDRQIRVVVYGTKSDKHTVMNYYPPPQGYTHTAIVPEDEHHALALYTTFAFGLVQALRTTTYVERWFEIEYDETELPGNGMWGLNALTREYIKINKLLVGGSVYGNHGNYVVYINHGPYPI